MCDNQSPWNTLEITKIVISFFIPVLLFWFGYTANDILREKDRWQIYLDKERRLEESRKIAVQTIARFIYERRTSAELLGSSLKRHASDISPISKKEIVERKRLYDKYYFKWNANHKANLLLVRQIIRADEYSKFERMVEENLVLKIFKPLDLCLTQAYDTAIRDKDPIPILEKCGSKALTQNALDCGYAITEELFQIAVVGSDEQREQSVSIVEQNCLK